MSFNRRRALALLAPGAALAVWLVLGSLILRATLAPGQRAALAPLVSSHGALLFGWWLVAAAVESHASISRTLTTRSRVEKGLVR